MQSFASAANFKAEANQGSNINGYIKKHPLTEHMTNQSWNNIPLPTREMFNLIADALIGQDIHIWERKSLINERFFKMQHLASKLHERIKEVKSEMTRWIEDCMKRTFEQCRKTELDLHDKSAYLEKLIKDDKK